MINTIDIFGKKLYIKRVGEYSILRLDENFGDPKNKFNDDEVRVNNYELTNMITLTNSINNLSSNGLEDISEKPNGKQRRNRGTKRKVTA